MAVGSLLFWRRRGRVFLPAARGEGISSDSQLSVGTKKRLASSRRSGLISHETPSGDFDREHPFQVSDVVLERTGFSVS